MEAPEKIYLVNDDLNIKRDWYRTKQVGFETTEYTRTDTFIEKAVKFMEKIDDVDEYSWYNEEEHAAGITEKCIEDFKTYMKGE